MEKKTGKKMNQANNVIAFPDQEEEFDSLYKDEAIVEEPATLKLEPDPEQHDFDAASYPTVVEEDLPFKGSLASLSKKTRSGMNRSAKMIHVSVGVLILLVSGLLAKMPDMYRQYPQLFFSFPSAEHRYDVKEIYVANRKNLCGSQSEEACINGLTLPKSSVDQSQFSKVEIPSIDELKFGQPPRISDLLTSVGRADLTIASRKDNFVIGLKLPSALFANLGDPSFEKRLFTAGEKEMTICSNLGCKKADNIQEGPIVFPLRSLEIEPTAVEVDLFFFPKEVNHWELEVADYLEKAGYTKEAAVQRQKIFEIGPEIFLLKFGVFVTEQHRLLNLISNGSYLIDHSYNNVYNPRQSGSPLSQIPFVLMAFVGIVIILRPFLKKSKKTRLKYIGED